MTSGVWEFASEPAAPAPVRARTRPARSAEDFAALMWRRRALMLAVFLVVLALGLVAALRMKTSYVAGSSLLVRLGQEYVYEPRVGDAGRGAVPQNDEVIQSEVEILNSAEIKRRVLDDVGLARFSPALARQRDRAATAQDKAEVDGAALRQMEGALKIGTAPDTSIVRLTYSHPDPRVAALVLNTLVDEYLRYRKTVLLARDTGPLAGQRKAFEGRLQQAEGALTGFLNANGIGDFDAEKASLATLYGQLLADGSSARAQLSEAQGRLGATSALLSRAQAEIGLYRDIDHTAGDKLSALKVELQDLRARYQPTSQPVQDKALQVAAMEKLAAAQADLAGARRIGPNPVYQALQTDRNQVAAQAASLRSRSGAVQSELARVVARRQTLAGLEPRYQELLRDRDLLAANVKTFAARQEDAQASQALVGGGDDGAVRVVQRAYVPSRGSSLKQPVLMASLVFAALGALGAGLVAAFLAPGYATSDQASRALDLPVLAVAPAKARA